MTGVRIGSAELFTVETGRFRLDGGAMFGVVPKSLWNRTNPADELNRIELALRALLIKKDGRNILVDTGAGDKMPEKLRGIYGIDQLSANLARSLQALNLTPADITDVIVTHLHFDHVGGAVEKKGNLLVPAFPNARYYVQKRQWEWAQSGNERDRASYFAENYLALKEHGVLDLTDGDTELFPGIHLVMLDGHTFGQQLVRLEAGGESLLYCGDLVPTASHVPAPYIMGYDLQPVVTLAEKHRLLDRAAEENWILYYEHDPSAQASRVTMYERMYRAKEAGPLEALIGGSGA